MTRPATTPTRNSDRIVLLDTIRGFALFGIMFINMTWFTGFAVLSNAQRERLGTLEIDETVNWLVEVLVAGKFWTIFAFLFGVGIAIQFERQGSSPRQFKRQFVRRIFFLLLMGLGHAIFLWFGDIVSLYAAAGIIVLFFISRSASSALIWGLILLVAPIAQLALWLFFYSFTEVADATDPGHGPAALLPVFGSGSYREVFAANWQFLKERWLIAIYDGRFLKLAGLFLIGWWAGRKGVLANPIKYRRLLVGAVLLALFVGLPANLLAHSVFPGVTLRPPSLASWSLEALKTVGIPVLGLGYVAAIAICSSSNALRRVFNVFAVTGRLSLTNYVMQSILGIVIFYGYGFRQWGTMGITGSIGLILGIFVFQFVFSHIWLHFFRFGPLEWVWRCLSYGTVFRMRKSRELDVAMQSNPMKR